MSLAFVPPRQRGKSVPDQATIQKVSHAIASAASATVPVVVFDFSTLVKSSNLVSRQSHCSFDLLFNIINIIN